jgi:hypothetical protein
MLQNLPSSTRRQFLRAATATSATLTTSPATWAKAGASASPSPNRKAQIAITLDLEMARNFPRWQDTHWDYEKGNLNQAAKDYTVRACQQVKD